MKNKDIPFCTNKQSEKVIWLGVTEDKIYIYIKWSVKGECKENNAGTQGDLKAIMINTDHFIPDPIGICCPQ